MDGQCGTGDGESAMTDMQSHEATHPALSRLTHVLEAFEDCIKELEEAENILNVENRVPRRMARNKGAWRCRREELQLVAMHARERLIELTREVRADVALISEHGQNMTLSADDIAESKRMAMSSSVMLENGGSGCEETSRRDGELLRWCPHTCDAHEEMMDPSLWGKLPESLVDLIFARLPLNSIVRLQNLSNSWKLAVRLSKPFQQSCANLNSKRFALVTSNQCRDCKIHFCDVNERKWYLKTLDAVSYGFWASPVAAAGGLLCIVDLHKLSYGALSIFMCNPLTNQSRVLPPLSHVNRFPKLVQLVVDAQTRHYKLIVVGASHRAETLLMEVYDSYTNLWESGDTNPVPGHTYRDGPTSICGSEFSYEGQYEGLARYDTKERALYRLRFPSHPNMLQPPTKNDVGVNGTDVFALVGTLRNQEGLFKLWADPDTGESQWVAHPVKRDATSFFTIVQDLVSFPRTYYKRVFVAGSLILAVADNRERADHNHHQILMLNDMSGDGRWVELPKLGKGEKCGHWELNTAIMMELRWDATA